MEHSSVRRSSKNTTPHHPPPPPPHITHKKRPGRAICRHFQKGPAERKREGDESKSYSKFATHLEDDSSSTAGW